MNKKDLDSKEICAIIKTCRDCNVREFALGDMWFKMSATHEEQEFLQASRGNPIEALQTESEVKQDIVKKSEILDLEELMFTDPELYEKTIIEGDIKDESDGE